MVLLDAQRDLRPKPQEWIATARRELARAFEISHQTMTLVRGENAGPVRVTDVLEDVLKNYSGKIAYKGITIERRYEFKEIIEADAGAVRQVFANIVLNALEAAPRGTGKLVIRSSASPSQPKGCGGCANPFRGQRIRYLGQGQKESV